MSVAGGETWFTAARLAELTLPGLPRVKRKVNERALAESWALRTDPAGQPLARPTGRRGGGLEYHYSVLPAAARAAIVARLAPAPTPANDPAPKSQLWAWYDRAPAKVKAEAERRAAAIAAVDRLVAAQMTRSAAVASAAARAGVGQSTLWSWLELVAGVAPADRLPHLAPRRTGGGATADVDDAAWQLLKSDYLRPERPTFATCYRRMLEFAKANGIQLPCERTIRRKFEREIDGRLVVAKRVGADALRQTLPPQRRSVADLHAMEAVNIDGHRWDVFVKWPDGRVGRPMMVAIQDIYSRKFLAWRIDESESALATRLVFADLFRDWGIPRACLMDNGRAFAAKSITGGAKSRYRFKIKEFEPTGVLTALGIAIHWALPYRGSSKPIERGFRDFCDAIARHPAFAGAYTGNTPLAKPENYGDRAIPLEEFTRIVAAGIAEHNARDGRATETAQGRSFDATFAESYAITPIGKATPEQLRLALLTAEDRRCDRKTSVITLEGNRYWAPELSAYSGQLLTVRFDPDNLHGEIHVYDREGRFIVTAAAIAAVGFFDKKAANQRRKAEAELRRDVRDIEKREQLLDAAAIAAMLPGYIDEDEPVAPTVIRPVRARGNLAIAVDRSAQEERERQQGATLDRMMGAVTRLRAVD